MCRLRLRERLPQAPRRLSAARAPDTRAATGAPALRRRAVTRAPRSNRAAVTSAAHPRPVRSRVRKLALRAAPREDSLARPAVRRLAPRRAVNRKVIEAGTRTPTTEAGEGTIPTVAEVAGGMIEADVASGRSVGAGWGLAGRVGLVAVFSRAAQVAGAITARRVGAGAVGIRG